MSSPSSSSRFTSSSMNRTCQWVFSQDIPTDVLIQVGDAKFPLHKFLLVAKSGYLRRKVVESDPPNLSLIDISSIPGGADAFERAAKFCYGVNFEISVNNVAALNCAAVYLEMTDEYYPENLVGRTEDFLARAALKSLPGALAVLRSCEGLGIVAEQIGIVQRCVDVIALKTCVESKFSTRSPADWWASELATLSPAHFIQILPAMKLRSASAKSLATAFTVYANHSLPGVLSASTTLTLSPSALSRYRLVLETITSHLPAALPIPFVCYLLRAAIHLECSTSVTRSLEKRISAELDQASVADLLIIALDYAGESIVDLDSVRRIITGFVEKEMRGGAGLYGGDVLGGASTMVQKVVKLVDAFVGEIATDEDLGVSKFASVAGALPKTARKFDDDIYRAVDIYLKIHPSLDEIEREKVCNVMDPLKLSYEARLHASQNKRLPLQVVLHALYHDHLKVRSGAAAVEPAKAVGAVAVRGRAVADASLMKENEDLRSELLKMKMYMTDIQRSQGSSGSKGPKKATFFSSVSKKLGKLNPFGKTGSKDTLSIDDDGAMVSSSSVMKPKRRRFSMS